MWSVEAREFFVNDVKLFCKESKITFVDDVKVGNSLLILITGDNSAKKLEAFLTEQGWRHSTPMAVSDAIGSYVECELI